MTSRHGPIESRSELSAPAETVWAAVTDFGGINAELWPILRMTHPPAWRRLDPDRIQPGERLFRSWLLLLGVLPVDYDDITLAEVGPGHRFQERSTMLSSAVWEHERVVRPAGDERCEVIDRVAFVPRSRLLGPLLLWLVPRLFAHRHRRLRRRFGTRAVR